MLQLVVTGLGVGWRHGRSPGNSPSDNLVTGMSQKPLPSNRWAFSVCASVAARPMGKDHGPVSATLNVHIIAQNGGQNHFVLIADLDECYHQLASLPTFRPIKPEPAGGGRRGTQTCLPGSVPGRAPVRNYRRCDTSAASSMRNWNARRRL
jgi:hypothetical protein